MRTSEWMRRKTVSEGRIYGVRRQTKQRRGDRGGEVRKELGICILAQRGESSGSERVLVSTVVAKKRYEYVGVRRNDEQKRDICLQFLSYHPKTQNRTHLS